MKRKIRGMVFSLAIVLTLAISASAQSGALVVNIPFDFYLGKTALSSGEYIVSLTGNGEVLQMTNKDNRKGIFSMSMPAAPPRAQARSVLVFSRYGDEHFLSTIYWAESGRARQLPKGELEIEVAKNFARGTRIIAGASK